MNRYLTFFLLAVLTGLLIGAGCLQDQAAPAAPTQTPLSGHAAMQQALANVTDGVQSTLDGLDFTIADAAEALGETGLSGPGADEVLAQVAVAHPAIINVITYGPDGTVLAAEPAAAQILLGQSLMEYDIVKKTTSTREAQMSTLLSLAEGGEGAALAHPVFSPDGKFLGVVSAGFSPYVVVAGAVAEETMRGGPYTYMAAQTDGRIIYDPDPEEVGRETFNETLFADFPEIIALAHQYAGNRTGYDTYSFYSTGFGKVVSKETFWDTVQLHGTEWRVLVIGEL